MKIETGWENKKVQDLKAGVVICYEYNFYIITDSFENRGYRCCVDLETGSLIHIPCEATVAMITHAVLKVGGYCEA